MQIIIPITGNGSRFVAAGYQELKPFIPVLGKPMIEWVVDLFDVSSTFIFICRQEHLDQNPNMKSYLLSLKPKTKVCTVDNWVKLGPVVDVFKCSDAIDDTEPVMVSYCDYMMQWSYRSFIERLQEFGCEGAIPCYTGFHPHLIPSENVYASCLKDKNENLIEIREKHSWTRDKTLSSHSPGVYYFKTGSLLKKYFKVAIDQKQITNGEHYVSLVYNQMVEDGLTVWCPDNVTHFAQWGTPEDMQASVYWIDKIFSNRTRETLV